MSKFSFFLIPKLIGYLIITSTVSSLVFAVENLPLPENKPLVSGQSSIDDMLDRTELIIHTNLEEAESLLLEISRNPRPLDQLQRHRLMLLQANRLILETDFEQADDVLDQLMYQRPNTAIMIRAIYFGARIAEILEDFERAFLYLHRLDQYPSPSISMQQQFDIFSLATNLYTRGHAFSQATGYAQRALSIATQSKSPRLICYALRAKSDVYMTSKDLERSKVAAIEAIDVCEGAGEQVALAAANINLSYWHREQEDYATQRILIEKAIELYQQQHFVVSMNSANLLLAEAYLLDNDVLKAQKVLSSVFNDVEQLRVTDDLVLGYRIKAMLYEKLGQPDEAMLYFKKYLAAQNTSNDLIRVIHIAYLQTRFNSKIYQQSGVIGQVEQRNIELIARAEMLTNLIIVTTSLLFLSVSFYCFTFYRRRHSVSMVELSNLDELTQLFNASYGFGVARNMLENSCHNEGEFGVICIDLDFMSAVNNSFSHDFGDILLQAFANKINCLVSDSGIVIRHSGDYFIAFIPDLAEDKLTDLVIEMHQCLDGLTIDRQKIIVSCSIGWTMQQSSASLQLSENLSLLIEQALQALRQAKYNGRNQWVRYEPGKIDESIAEEDYRNLSY